MMQPTAADARFKGSAEHPIGHTLMYLHRKFESVSHVVLFFHSPTIFVKRNRSHFIQESINISGVLAYEALSLFEFVKFFENYEWKYNVVTGEGMDCLRIVKKYASVQNKCLSHKSFLVKLFIDPYNRFIIGAIYE